MLTKKRTAMEAEGRSFVPERLIPRTPSLGGNVLWALGGNVGYTVCQWGVLACLAKLGTASDVGRFPLGPALTAPVITLSNLHLPVLEGTAPRASHPLPGHLPQRLLL